jgi:DUF438 domain-containing protein
VTCLTKPILNPEHAFKWYKAFSATAFDNGTVGITEVWRIFRKLPNKITFVDSRMVLISSADLTFNLNIHNHIQ